ncbi:NAD-binding protein [Mycobacterium sp.]|uniref:NAD-binding protein n=1 Tax=Mycobacterium sp. TaxID=1785 RepID=UPI0031D1E903
MKSNHIVVSGSDALARTIVEELKNAGAIVVKLGDDHVAGIETGLADAGIADALAVVCAGDDDSINLEIALLARKVNPEVRVVARLANDILRAPLRDDDGRGAIFNVAELAATSVVEACVAGAHHPFEAAGTKFVILGSSASRDGATLGELHEGLAPVAVIRGENSPTPGAMEICPSRDLRVFADDWTVMLGTADAMVSQRREVPQRVQTHSRRSRPRRILDAMRAFGDDMNPAFYAVLVAVCALMVVSVAVLHFSYTNPRMGWIDALYFTVETITTTGFGDFSFVAQPTWLRLFAIMLMFGGVTTISLLVAFVADVLLSRRFVLTFGRPRIRHLRRHVVVVGLSALGIRVVSDLVAAGYDVAVIERDEENRMVPAARELDVPVIFGDATLVQTLRAAQVDRARAVAVLTRDDMINIETGIMLAELHGRHLRPTQRRPEIPLVLRVFDRALGVALAQQFGFVNARSTVELAAPWFIGAAIGLKVLDTFSVGQHSFVVGEMRVESGSELDGLRVDELSAQTMVIAVARVDAQAELHPRPDTRLQADDTVYLIGPYRELLHVLRVGRSPSHQIG